MFGSLYFVGPLTVFVGVILTKTGFGVSMSQASFKSSSFRNLLKLLTEELYSNHAESAFF